ILEAQAPSVLGLLRGIGEEQSLHRYAAGKWSLRDLLNHLNDTERLFVSRAMWFARGFESPLPSFDQDVAVTGAAADRRSWSGLVEEFGAVRASTVGFFRGLPSEAWGRRGIASGNPFTVRALAFIAAGHVAHHVKVVRERYLPA
ncbi:MAG: DinB family protein, partial [Gemmatimonadota bacterium]